MNPFRAIALGLLLILAVALGVQTYRLSRAADREVRERAARQAVELVAAGWEKTATATQAELARIVPELQAQIEAARKAGTTLAGSGTWTGHGNAIPVPVPCEIVKGSPASTPPPGAATPAASPEAPPTVAVTPHVRIDDAVALDDAGGIYVARKVQARLSVGTAWESKWEWITPDSSTTAVAPALEAAWKAYRNPPPKIGFVRPPKQWRAGMSCGIGLGYGVLARGVDVTAACLYGVQF
jgi:hypothetical protein